MNGRRTLSLVIVLAVICVAGLVIMLVADAALWDRIGFALTAAPLVIGLWRIFSAQPPPRRQTSAAEEDDTSFTDMEGE